MFRAISCLVCGTAVKRENLERHMRRVHHADVKDVTITIPAANVPTSAGRIVKLRKFSTSQGSRKKHGSGSVFPIGGGLPDSKRSRH